MGRFAFDLEMVTVDGEPESMTNPEEFELLTAGVGFEHRGSGEIETDVLFRKGSTPRDELALIRDLMDYVDARDVDTVLTYNGDRFDYTHLIGRAKLCAAALPGNEGAEIVDRVETFLHTYEHDDLKHDVWEAFGDYTRLEEAAEKIGYTVDEPFWWEYETHLDPREWRTYGENVPVIGGRDMPFYGERLLTYYDNDMTHTKTFREIYRLIHDYTIGDITPMFAIADSRPLVSPIDKGQLTLPSRAD